MAQQTGPLSLKGKLGELSFYHNKQYGYLVRMKGGPSSERVIKDPAFVRTRENASEFAHASNCGKLIRSAVKSVTGLKGDGNVSQRLQSLLVNLGKSDTSSVRGKRSPTTVFTNFSSQQQLKTFAFYKSSSLEQIFRGIISCDSITGNFLFKMPVSGDVFQAPTSATHIQIKTAVAALDFDHKTFTLCETSERIAALDSVAEDIALNCTPEGIGPGFRMGIVSLVFMQERNGQFYVLQEGMSVGLV